MQKIDWVKILEEERDGIREALIEAYTDACGGNLLSGFSMAVKIDHEGNFSDYIIGSERTPSDVWAGKAIEIARIACFNPLNDTDETEEILPYLKDEELQAFTRFLDGKRPSLHQLRQWKPEIADRVEKEYIDNYVSETASDWASRTLDEALARAAVYDREEELKAELAELGKS